MDNLLRIDQPDFFQDTPMPSYISDIKAPIMPAMPTVDPFANAMDQFAASNRGSASDDVAYAGRQFDYKRNNADRYVNSDYYNELGYDDRRDNESLYGYRQTWGNTVSNAFGGAWRLGTTGFVDGWKGWGRMGEALVNMDWKKLAGDEESMKELNDKQNAAMNDNAIFATPESDATFWNRQTFGNFLQQSGFTLGTLAQTVTEQAITKALEVVLFAPTGGAASAALETAEDARSVANITRLFASARSVNKGMTLAKAAKDAAEAGSTLWKDGKLVESFMSKAVGKIPGVELFRDMKMAKDWGASATTIAAVGVGGVKRGLSELNLALTEARMEGANTYGAMHDQLYYDFLDKNGRAPNGQELQKLQAAAYNAGKDNFVFNSLLLSTMNRIQFDNMFKSFKSGTKLGQFINHDEEGIASKLLTVAGKDVATGKPLTQVYEKGMLGVVGAAGKISKDFGKKEAAYQVGKSLLSGHLAKWELTEGIQELLQNGSNDYFTSYHTDLYGGKTPNREDILSSAIDKEASMEGFKTFISGALTGLITSGPAGLVQHGMSRLGSTAKERKDSKDYIQTYATDMNTFMRSPASFLSEINKNLNIQTEGSKDLDSALKNKDKFAFENIRQSMLGSLASRALRMNGHEALIDTLNNYGKYLSKEEFEQAFVGIGYNDKNKASAQEYVGKIASSVQSYVDTYENLHDKLDRKINPDIYPPNSNEYKEAQFAKMAQDHAIEILAGNAEKGKNASMRMTEILTQVSAHPNMGASLGDTFTVLGSVENTNNEISMLKGEISSMEKAGKLDRDSAIVLRQKKAQLESLEGFAQHHDSYFDVVELDNGKYGVQSSTKTYVGNKKPVNVQAHSIHNTKESAEKIADEMNGKSLVELHKHYKNYLTHKNRQNGINVPITDADYDENFSRLNDYRRLNEKARQHTDAFNTIMNPKNFVRLQNRLMAGQRFAAIKQMVELIDAGIEGMRGFKMANKELIEKFEKLKNKDELNDLDEEGKEEYYKLCQELNRAIHKYALSGDAAAYMQKLDMIVFHDPEFLAENKELVDKYNDAIDTREHTEKDHPAYQEAFNNEQNLKKLVYDRAEEFISKHGIKDEEPARSEQGTTNDTEAKAGETVGTSQEGTENKSTVAPVTSSTGTVEVPKTKRAEIIRRRDAELAAAFPNLTITDELVKEMNARDDMKAINFVEKYDSIVDKYDAELATLEGTDPFVMPQVDNAALQKSAVDELLDELDKHVDSVAELEAFEASFAERDSDPQAIELSVDNITIIENAIKDRMDKLPIFGRVEQHNIVQMDGKLYQVINNPTTDNYLTVREYPTGNQATITLSPEEVNKKVTYMYKNSDEMQLKNGPKPEPVTPEVIRTVEQSQETNTDFHKDAAAITDAIKEADNKSAEDIAKDWKDGLGCE